MKPTQKKKLKELHEASAEYNLRSSQYRNILKVNHCLPTKKARQFEIIGAEYLVRMVNAQNTFNNLFDKYEKKYGSPTPA